MVMSKVHYSSNSVEWETPQELFDELNKEFDFNLDVCATKENAKCKKYFTKKDDGLHQEWGQYRCWMNPPYGSEIGMWVQHAAFTNLCVSLLPARTDTRWFHDYIYKNPRAEIRFLKGRLRFSGQKSAAPFPNMIVIFRRKA